MSSSTITAITTIITITTIIVNFTTALLPPPLALPTLPAYPTRIITALSLLAPIRVLVLQPGRTTNPVRPINLEAKLGQITS